MQSNWTRCAAAFSASAILFCATSGVTQEASPGAQAQSAIPWLSQSVEAAPESPPSSQAAPLVRPQPSTSVQTSIASGPDRDATGLIASDRAGFSTDMWLEGDSDYAIALLDRLPPSDLPGAQDLLFRLVLSEATPPDRDDDRLLLARIDALLQRGALDRAQALIERANPDTPDLFRRWFDISLLTGSEDRACGALEANAELSPSLPARIYCLVRAGRWMTATVTLESAWGLGDMSSEDYTLLSRFLDPELFEGAPPLPRPKQTTPLHFRLYEAIGEPLPTRDLPLAFSWSDLRFVAGWKAQIEAAERLARVGSLDSNRLLGLYTERRPAASGGVWERVHAVQALDLALNANDSAAVGLALLDASTTMKAAGLEAVLAAMIAPRLERITLSGQSKRIATRLMLLRGQSVSPVPLEMSEVEQLANTVLSGAEFQRLSSAPERAVIARVFEEDNLRIQEAQAELILAALTLFAPGAEADLQDRVAALRMLRSVGQETSARRIASDYLLLGGARS